MTVLIALLTACSSTPSLPEGVDLSAEFAPVPYTVDQLSTYNQVGRTYVFRVQSPAAPDMRRTMQFDEVDENGAWVVSTIAPWDQADAPPDTTRSYQTWDELQRHAAYPAEQTTRSWSSATLPTGEQPCVLYTVQEGEGRKSTACFNVDTAGPPVHLTQVDTDAVVFSMTLQSTGM